MKNARRYQARYQVDCNEYNISDNGKGGFPLILSVSCIVRFFMSLCLFGIVKRI